MSKTAFSARNDTCDKCTTKWGLVLFNFSFLPFISQYHLAYLQLRYSFLYSLNQPSLYTKNAGQLPEVFSTHSYLQVYFLRSSLNSNNHLHSKLFESENILKTNKTIPQTAIDCVPTVTQNTDKTCGKISGNKLGPSWPPEVTQATPAFVQWRIWQFYSIMINQCKRR